MNVNVAEQAAGSNLFKSTQMVQAPSEDLNKRQTVGQGESVQGTWTLSCGLRPRSLGRQRGLRARAWRIDSSANSNFEAKPSDASFAVAGHSWQRAARKSAATSNPKTATPRTSGGLGGHFRRSLSLEKKHQRASKNAGSHKNCRRVQP